MKIAILSDIHGNFHALRAVLGDISRDDIDQVIYLGDYYGEFSSPNQVISVIEDSETCIAVAGNKECYFNDKEFTCQENRVFQQFNTLYWNLEHIDEKRMSFIRSLNIFEQLETPFYSLLIAHKAEDVVKSSIIKEINSSNYALLNQIGQENRETYLRSINNVLNSNDDLVNEMNSLDEDIFLFGHTHIQWHCYVNEKLLVNPGSIGLPLDHSNGAKYTVLTLGETIIVDERSVEYDIGLTIQELRDSELYEKARFWSDLAISQLISSKDEGTFFFKHMNKIKELDFDNELDRNSLYHEACRSWETNKSKVMPN